MEGKLVLKLQGRAVVSRQRFWTETPSGSGTSRLVIRLRCAPDGAQWRNASDGTRCYKHRSKKWRLAQGWWVSGGTSSSGSSCTSSVSTTGASNSSGPGGGSGGNPRRVAAALARCRTTAACDMPTAAACGVAPRQPFGHNCCHACCRTCKTHKVLPQSRLELMLSIVVRPRSTEAAVLQLLGSARMRKCHKMIGVSDNRCSQAHWVMQIF